MYKKSVGTHKKKMLTRKRLGLIAVTLFLFAAILAVLDVAGVVKLPFIHKAPQKTSSNGTINYGPPTEQEKKETEEFKDRQGTNSGTTSPSTPGQKKSVVPVITSWGQDPTTKIVDASGYVAGIYEAGGNCTLTLEKSGQKITESKEAIKDAQTVSCGVIKIDSGRLSAGIWSATLTYSSSTSQGTSQAVNIEVQ